MSILDDVKTIKKVRKLEKHLPFAMGREAEFVDFLLDFGFKTGSQVMGYTNEDSDHDFVISVNDLRELQREFCNKDFCLKFGGHYGNFMSVKFNHNRKTINAIITQDEREKRSYIHATNLVMNESVLSVCKNKKLRHQIFELLRADFMGVDVKVAEIENEEEGGR